MKMRAVLITAAVAVAGFGVGWLVTGHNTSTPPAPAVAAAEPSGTTVTPPSGALADVVPPDVTWQLVNTIAVPVSPSAGPTRVSPEGIRSGFAHTPSGALLAAGNYTAADAERFTAAGPDTTALIAQRVLPWPGREQDQAAAVDNAAHPSTVKLVMQIAGFRFLAYDGDHATILIAQHITTPNAPQSGYTPWINLAWVDGDWWIVPAIDGHGEIGTPTGWPLTPDYTAWAGVA
ncbi:MAG TPA: hypothetical protein VIJ23_19740 [Mycobacterium sp.]